MGEKATGFSRLDAQRIARTVRTVERLAPPTLGGGGDTRRGFHGTIWVKLGAEHTSGLGHYQWSQYQLSAGAFTAGGASSPTGIYSAIEANGTSGLTGKYVELTPAGVDGSSNPLYVFSYTIPPLVPVTVSQTGGSAGGVGAFCTFTYSWTDPAGTSHSGSTPIWNSRPNMGTMQAGGNGLVKWSGSVWQLYMVDETISAGICTAVE